MDRARTKTDKLLHETERKIDKVYANSLALRRIQKKYAQYMAMVESKTKDAYNDYVNETDTDIKPDLKKAYMKQLEDLTLKSKKYKAIIDEFTSIMAEVNQDALDLVNGTMPEVYKMNYNQVAVECRKVGIEVDGKEE